jgi:hypothetical protein
MVTALLICRWFRVEQNTVRLGASLCFTRYPETALPYSCAAIPFFLPQP